MLFLPFRTDNPTLRWPIVTSLLILINVLVYLLEVQLAGSGALNAALRRWAVVPFDVTHQPGPEVALDFLRSMFLHSGWIHLLGNMLYLWIFGKNIEDTLGEGLFLAFYLVCGVAASLAHVAIAPNSPLPLVGASGAIAGTLGAYLLLFPNTRVRVFFWFLVVVRIFRPRAIVVLGLWFLMQAFQGYASLGAGTARGGVAYAAHVGGFLTGLAIVGVLIATRPIWAARPAGGGDA